MDMTIVGYFLVIGIIAVVYWFFTKFDSDQAEKRTDRIVRKTLADTERQKLRVQQEELKLKQEIVRMEREKNTPKGIQADYKVVDKLEDKSDKTDEPPTP